MSDKTIRTALIGCGKRGGHFTEAAIKAGAEMVGFCDALDQCAHSYSEKFGAPAFTDFRQMLAETKPQFVMVVTRPAVRLEPILACADAGVGGVLCEKPMALSLGEARRIHDIAEQSGTQLSFCHQRRLMWGFALAKKLIADGAIGKLETMEGWCDNFFDWATHWYDQFFYWNGDDVPAEWVLAAADFSGGKTVFDVPVESANVSTVRYANGVFGRIHGGASQPRKWLMQAIGDEGMIELGAEGSPFKLRRWGGDGPHGEQLLTPPPDDNTPGVPRAVAQCLSSLRTGEPTIINSRRALAATEMIFASLLSAEQGGRVYLPLSADVEGRTIASFFNG